MNLKKKPDTDDPVLAGLLRRTAERGHDEDDERELPGRDSKPREDPFQLAVGEMMDAIRSRDERALGEALRVAIRAAARTSERENDET